MKVFKLPDFQCTLCSVQLKPMPNNPSEVEQTGKAKFFHADDGRVYSGKSSVECPNRRKVVIVPIEVIELEVTDESV